tara:strand:- start:5194 stop:6075 length:882 start_codon:yes stop_codon:yes gene_type:complete
MGYTKPKETSRHYLEAQTLPNHGKSYTVISHKQVIDNTMNLLTQSGFTIIKEIYRSNMNANVAQGIYHIQPNNPSDSQIMNEEELGMMFAWTNSYDKSTRFQCAIGAYVKVCSNGMVAGEMMNFKRKHTGTADRDVKTHMSDQIKNAEKYYKRIITDKDFLKSITIDCKESSELVGRLFIDEDMLDTQQLSSIKAEIDKPSYDYNTDENSAWAFYNHITHALKKAHPRDWLVDQQNFHDFITNELINPNLYLANEINTDNSLIDITMQDVVEVVIDEDITDKRLMQEMYMGRI